MIEPVVLKNGVSSVGGTVDVYTLATLDLLGNEVAYLGPHLSDVLSEQFVSCVLIQPQSCLVLLHVRDGISDWILSRVADEGAEAAPVYVVSLHIEYFEPVF